MTQRGISTAVVLVGGLGTRLRPLTNLLPKPLLPLLDIPLIGHQILWLARNGIQRVILAAGYKAERLRSELLRHDWGLELTVVEEPEPLDTAGAIKFASQGLEETFLATNGDLILNPSLADMVAAHEAAGAAATIMLRRVEDVSHYGLVLRDDTSRVIAFLEKKPEDETGQRTVNAGVYLLEPNVLHLVPERSSWSIERRLFPDLLASGAVIHGHLPARPYYWIDVGRLDTYRQAHRDLLAGVVDWCGPWVSEQATISPQAKLVAPVFLSGGVRVGPEAVVGPFVSLSPCVEVGEGARVEDSIVWATARVGHGARVVGCVVTPEAVVPDGESISDRIVMPK